MHRFLTRIGRRRKQLSIGALMVVVAVIAVLVNCARPITRAEAAWIAEAHFRTIPEASQWVGGYHVRAWPAGSTDGDIWFIDFTESEGGSHLAQITVTSRGKLIATGIDALKLRSGASVANPSR
jgi:hypothetical protein